MQVEKGQVFRFDNGAFLLAVENKELTDPDEKIRCAWSKTGLDGEHLYPVKKSELEARTEILDEFYDVPERGFFSEAEEKFKFRHEACGQLAVTNDDFTTPWSSRTRAITGYSSAYAITSTSSGVIETSIPRIVSCSSKSSASYSLVPVPSPVSAINPACANR